MSAAKIESVEREIEASTAVRSPLAWARRVLAEGGVLILETPKRPDLNWPDELKDYLRVSGDGKETLLVPLRFLRINDEIVIWSAPLELFCEISNEIRASSPFSHTFYAGYTNGTFAYLPTEEEFRAGGYEPATSPFTAAAAGHLIAVVNRHLREIHDAQ